MRIATPRFDLRLLDAGDAALYDALYGDSETMAFVATARDPAQLARGFAASCAANAASPPRRRTWVIRERTRAQDVGLIGLVWDAAPEDGRQGAELGVMLPPAWQGRGVASEAIAALCVPAFAEFGLEFLHTWHDDGHGLAAGLMRSVGFEPQAPREGDSGCRWRRVREHG